MSEHDFSRSREVVDQFGNRHYLATELARGGQGVVYRTGDPDLAIKQPLGADGAVRPNVDMRSRFQNVLCLPIPSRIPISLPLAVLRDEPGYVMRLLSDMEPLSEFALSGQMQTEMAKLQVPKWLAGVHDKRAMLSLMHYASSGSTKRRLLTLAKCAGVLARLHAAGIVYGDVSPRNCFMSRVDSREVWLIDADNLRFERHSGGETVYTPRYGAPEVVRAVDQSRPRTDAWAFSVMAFEALTMLYPFMGSRVLAVDDLNDGWDAKSATTPLPGNLEEQAYVGLMPYVDDPDDSSNCAIGGLPRNLVLTSQLISLFQETLGIGRTQPWRRPSLAFWAIELARAHDRSVVCPECSMSYFLQHKACPYCGKTKPSLVRAKTLRWEFVMQPSAMEVALPHRLLNPFSLDLTGCADYLVSIDVKHKTVNHARGTDPLPPGITFEFLGEGE